VKEKPMSVIDRPRPSEFDDELARLLAEEVEHTEDLEERTERLEMRQMLGTVFSFMAMAGVLVVAVLTIALNSDDNGSSDVATGSDEPSATEAVHVADGDVAAGGSQAAAQYTGKVEAYKRPDPTLPATPAGGVKRFKVEVYEHVTKVAKDLPPTRVWSYGINGVFHRGTGVSTPMVVTEGDMVEVTLVNGGSKAMDVKFPHSIDYHSSEVAPNEAFKSINPGETHTFEFRADHPGVFMYHCATQPVLMHTGAGMVGMMVVKPKNIAAVDRELWMTQQEFYVGEPGKDADM
jgi:nitrite reductase (NO-forming)